MIQKSFINIAIIAGIIIAVAIMSYFILSRLTRSLSVSTPTTNKTPVIDSKPKPNMRKDSVVEYTKTGGMAGIRDEFVIRKNGCYGLNWSGSGLINGNLSDDKLSGVKQVFEENDFLNIDYDPSQSVSDDFYASIGYANAKGSNDVAFGLETLRSFKPNNQVSNIFSKLNSVIDEIVNEKREKTTEGYLNIKIQGKLQKWILKDEFNLEQSLSTVVGQKRKIDIAKEKIPDKIHQYFISEFSQRVEEYMENKNSSVLGITGGGQYFQDNKVYGVTASLGFDDYKENKISGLYVYDEIISQWPENINIPFAEGKQLIKNNIYKQVKNFTDSVKIAQFYKFLENNAAVYIINLTPKLDATSYIDNARCL